MLLRPRSKPDPTYLDRCSRVFPPKDSCNKTPANSVSHNKAAEAVTFRYC
jgi:hypothetical protein